MKLHSTLLTMLVAPSLIFSVSASAFEPSHRAVASNEAVNVQAKESGFSFSRLLRAAREASFINNAIDKIRSEIRRHDLDAEVQLPINLGKNLGVEIGYNYVVEGNGDHTLRKDGWRLNGNWTVDFSGMFNRLRPGVEVNFYSLSETRAEAGSKQIKSLQEFPDNAQDVIQKMQDGERVEVVAFLENFLGVGESLSPLGGGRVEAGLENKIKFILDVIKLKDNRAMVRLINVREDGTLNANARLNLLSPLRWLTGSLDRRLTRVIGDQARLSYSTNPRNLPGVLDSQVAEYEMDLNSQAGVDSLNEILRNLRETDTWKVLLQPDIKTNRKESVQAQRQERIQTLLKFVEKAEAATQTEGSGVLKNAQASTQDDYTRVEGRLPFFALASVSGSRQNTRSSVTDRMTGERMIILSRASSSGDGMLGAGKEVDLAMTLDAAFTVNREDRTFRPQMLKNFAITHYMYDQRGREQGLDAMFNKPTVNQMQDLIKANLPQEFAINMNTARWNSAKEVRDASLQFSVFYGRKLIQFLQTQSVDQVETACRATLSALSDEFLRMTMRRDHDCKQLAKNLVKAATHETVEKRVASFEKLRKDRLFSLAFPGTASQLLTQAGLSSREFMNFEVILQDSNGVLVKLERTGDESIQTELLENYRNLQSALGQGKDSLIEVMRENQ